MKEKVEVFQGEDLVMRLQGNENLNLDNYDFAVAFTKCCCCKVVKKEDCKQLEAGVYECVVSAEETASMPTGLYDVEMKVEGERVRIAVAKNVVLIKESVFRYGK